MRSTIDLDQSPVVGAGLWLTMAMAKQSTKPSERYASISPCIDCTVRACAVCADVGARDFVRLQRRVERIFVPARHVVAGGGRDAQILTLVEGVVMAYVALVGGPRHETRQVIGFHFAGDLLAWPDDGATPYDGGAPRVTLQSLTAAEICRIEDARLGDARHGFPALADGLLKLVGARVAAAREHVVMLGRGTAEQRVAWFLIGRARRTSAGDGDRSEIDLPKSRADIADYLGLEVETVSPVFSRLRADAVLSLASPKRVVPRDWRVLADLAGGKMLGEVRA